MPHVLKKIGCPAKAFEINVEDHPNPPAWMTGGPISTVPKVVFLNNGTSRAYEGERDISLIAKEACNFNLSGGSAKTLPPKLMMWREATIKALGKFSIPRRHTEEYRRVREVYEKMI